MSTSHGEGAIVLVGTVLLIVAIPMIWGCSDIQQPPRPDAGRLVDGMYVNDFFRLMLLIPEVWVVASTETGEYMMDLGKSVVAEGDPMLSGAAEVSFKNLYLLLTVSEREMGAAVEFNPNLAMIAERVSHMPGIRSGKESLFHTRKIPQQSGVPREPVGEIRSTDIGGDDLYREDNIAEVGSMTIRQTMLAAKRGDYAL